MLRIAKKPLVLFRGQSHQSGGIWIPKTLSILFEHLFKYRVLVHISAIDGQFSDLALLWSVTPLQLPV